MPGYESTYHFILHFDLPDPVESGQKYLDALYGEGCNDALVGVGRLGSIALDFTRTAVYQHDAIETAIAAVRRAIPGAKMTKVEPRGSEALVEADEASEMVPGEGIEPPTAAV